MIADSIQNSMLWLRWRLTGWLFFWYLVPHKLAAKLSTLSVPAARSLAFLSVGHLILLLPLLALAGSGIRYTFFQPSPNMSGHVAWYSVVATVLLANKSSSALAILLGQSWERLVPYHHLAAYIAIGNSFLHGFICYSCDGVHDSAESVPKSDYSMTYKQETDWSDDGHSDVLSEHSRYGEKPDLQSYLMDGDVNVSGTIMAVCMTCLALTSSIRWFREKRFDAWLVSHIVFSLGIASASLVHAMSEAKLIFLWWFADAFIRHVVTPKCCSPDTAVLTRLLPDLIEVRFRRCIRYRSGQFVRIAVHDIGQYEFHPVTISSACHESDMTLHFRVRGDWTKRLAEAAERCPEVNVSIQGPFGNLSMPLLEDSTRYPHVLLICGGIGVTPMMSLARDLVHRHNKGDKGRYIHLVWVVQNPDIAEALPILQNNETLEALDETEEMFTENNSDQSDEEIFTDMDDEHSDEEVFTDIEYGHSSYKTTSTSDKDAAVPGEGNSIDVDSDDEEEVFTDVEYGQASYKAMDSSDNVVTLKDDAVLQRDIYITKSDMLPNVSGANINYYRGRPDIGKIMTDTKSKIESMHHTAFVKCTSRVAVVACGPEKLVESAKIECRNQSSAKVVFDFHDEIFDY